MQERRLAAAAHSSSRAAAASLVKTWQTVLTLLQFTPLKSITGGGTGAARLLPVKQLAHFRAWFCGFLIK